MPTESNTTRRPCRYTAELGTNHTGARNRLLELVDAASASGFDAVKLQLLDIDRLYRPEASREKEHLRAYHLRRELVEEAARHARARGMEFGLTVFSPPDVEVALDLDADFLKVSSYEASYGPLLAAALASRLPVRISLGLVPPAWLWAKLLGRLGAVTLLHCASYYPAPPERCCLSRIAELRGGFPACRIGWSDHSANSLVVYRAVAEWGAEEVEMHLDLEDREGPETRHSFTPRGAADVIHATRSDHGEWRNVAELPWRMDEDGYRPLRGPA